ncbi:hypothetical protein AWJ20_1703 [Sugiyamaella lignohabitans]|uniref:Protein kinase domain-containing protein n=1 Tax=Sugiyamaella lignohabitans TaxID=796027 RepID=A0A167DXH5_9ASCO|nr:uncharacterized protein AWJ20_1703 [Sugiyamaella lignohabitans]ANB13412.1 hypothetical protein AWJ20_1703 [Sugiyamaella lignohabitans]
MESGVGETVDEPVVTAGIGSGVHSNSSGKANVSGAGLLNSTYGEGYGVRRTGTTVSLMTNLEQSLSLAGVVGLGQSPDSGASTAGFSGGDSPASSGLVSGGLSSSHTSGFDKHGYSISPLDNLRGESTTGSRLSPLTNSPKLEGSISPGLLAHNSSAMSSSPATGGISSYFPRPPLYRSGTSTGNFGTGTDSATNTDSSGFDGLSINIGVPNLPTMTNMNASSGANVSSGARTRASSAASLGSYASHVLHQKEPKSWNSPESHHSNNFYDDPYASRRPSMVDITKGFYSAENSEDIPELPAVEGYSELRPIYPYYYNSVSMYRATDKQTNEPVLIKVSTRGSLEDLTRIRHEWSVVYPESSSSNEIDHIDGVLRPERCIRIGDEPAKVVLVYPDRNHLVTLREKYISSVIPQVKLDKEMPAPLSVPSQSVPPQSMFNSLNNNNNATTNAANTANTNVGVNPATCNPLDSPKVPERTPQEVVDILKLMIGVVKTLGKIHEHTLTHNGLTTSTIFIDDNGDTFISGWDFSFSLRAEDTSRGYRKTHLKQIADCMGYVSPETTCLINRLVDFRADFYSVGCILYEILLGRLPFRSSDPSQLSHMHVLRTPIAPSLIANWVPETLSRIIMKLLEKNADDRYQSAKLVISDLEMVVQSLENPGCIDEDDFVPGSLKTVSSTFMVPQLIYGRESELAALQLCWNRNEETNFEFVFVVGEPGSGKSRLVGELERSAIAGNSFFSVTKYDEYQRGPPFYTIVTVLKDIVHQILSGSVEYITQWRDTIMTNLKVDLSVLFDSIPELKELLGYEYLMLLPKSIPLGPVPRELRFKFVVKSLFCLFGGQGLTVFLDDIQWCPPSELSLFRELSLFASEKYDGSVQIKFVCASTPDSWNTYTGLARLAYELNGLYEEVYLKPLSFEAVREIVNETFGNSSTRHHRGIRRRRRSHSSQVGNPDAIATTRSNSISETAMSKPQCQSEATGSANLQLQVKPYGPNFPSVDPQVQSLSETIYTVTTGNPLFVSFLLKYLFYEQYIYYDESNRLTGGKWKVDFERLNLSVVPKSVKDVVILIMKKLPPETNRILRYAACICSNSFTLEDLAIGANVSFSEAATALHAALDFQLILPTSIHYKFPFLDPVGTTNIELYDDEIRRVAAASTYRFYHDLVQQAVYSQLDPQEALEIHRLIGLRLLGEDDEQSRPIHRLLEIANQLKNAVPIVKEGEKSVYIELNVMAGNAVYAISDFDMAFAYFDTARKLLPDDSSTKICEEINLKLVELQYNRKNYDDCISLVDDSLSRFTSVLSKAALLRIKAMALYGKGEGAKATTTGLGALKLLGYEIQEDDEWNRNYCRKLRARIPISVSEIRELANVKRATDPKLLLVQQIISTVSIRLYLWGNTECLRSLVFTSLILFLDGGSSASCAFSLLSLANLFQKDGGSANLKLAYEYSKLAIVISECATAVSMDFGFTIYEYYALTLAIYFEPLPEVIR